MTLKEKIENICSKYTEFETVFDCDNWRKMVDELYDLFCDEFRQGVSHDDLRYY